MKQLIIAMLIVAVSTSIIAADFLTIYNNNQALYKTSIELDLRQGVQFYPFENIPTQIITESVVFVPRDRNVTLFSQNYEYDLADSRKTIQKYIGKNVRVVTEQESFNGMLIFFDGASYGLLNESTNEMSIVSATKVTNLLLAEMPTDFYLRPTLRWQVQAQRAGKYSADLSYLTRGIEWRATYNAVLNKNDMTLNSWVTLNNRSGKDFTNVTLKLIAGDVQTYQDLSKTPQYARGGLMYDNVAMSAAPEFSEREFSDFRLYTLDQPADIDNNQEKQLSLYPLKSVKYTRKYQYSTGNEKVDVMINFKNDNASGLGVPLPAGNIMFYEIDDKDNTQQFVGTSRIEHTSLNQERNLKIGSAFDVIAVTRTVNTSSTGRIHETDYEVKLTNNKSEAVEVEVSHRINATNNEVMNPSIAFEKKDAYTYIFKVRIPAGREQTLTFKQRVTN